MPIVRPQWNPRQALAILKRETFSKLIHDSRLWDSTLYQVTLLSPATLYCGKEVEMLPRARCPL